MAAVTAAGTTFNTTGGNTTVVATPAVGDLIVVVAATSGLTGGTTAITDNNSDGFGTTPGYIQVDQDRTGFSTTGVLTVWIRNALIGSATSTTFTAAQATSTGGGLTVLRVSGMSIVGQSAVRRIGVASWNTGGQSTVASGTPAPVLAATPLTTNVIITAMAHSTNGGTQLQRSSPAYAEDTDSSYNTPATGMEVSHINSGETSATITYGGAAPSQFASMAIELDTSVPQYDWVNVSRKADTDANRSILGAVGRASIW